MFAQEVSTSEARRITLTAQGFGSRAQRRGSVGETAARLRAIQIDPINVLVRTQYLPLFSRLGAYEMDELDRLTFERRQLFEYMGHQASLLSMDLYPLMRWRMEAFAQDPGWNGGASPEYVADVLAQVAERGPMAATELSDPGKRPGVWHSVPGKTVLWWLTLSGKLAVAGRRGLQQLYALPEQVIPADVLKAPAPARDDARRELLRRALQAIGIGTAKDIADYFSIGLGLPGITERRVHPKSITAAKLLDELVDDGKAVLVKVEGWRQRAYLSPDATDPKRIDARALLSPFDSLIWERSRVERLFGFRYKIEVYTPAAKRVYGYYVLPFLLNDAFVARLDLKAERKEGALAVQGAYGEAGVDTGKVVEALMPELRRMAGWLGLDRITVRPRGDLAEALAKAL